MSRIITYREALREALAARMQADPKLLLIGEDIGLYGGAFGVSRGLIERFASQIIETPISENGFVGVALGAAMGGYRSVVEIMFSDFVTLAMDQIVNHAAKIGYMYAGQLKVPLIVRLPSGGGRGYGASHSQSLEAWFAHVPGLVVLCPSNAADAKGLMNAALDEDSPVIFIENKLLYDAKSVVPEEDYRVPIGKARIVRDGADLTIVSYGRMVGLALDVAERMAELGQEVEVLDLRSLKPIDAEAIAQSVERTGRLVVLSEAAPHVGIAAEVAAIAAERCWDCMTAPVLRLSALDTPIPSSTRLESHVFPTVDGVVEAIVEAFP